MTIQHIMEGNGNLRFVRVVAVEAVEVSVAVAVLVEVVDGLAGAADVACASGVVVPAVAPLVLAAVVTTLRPLSGWDLAGARLDFAWPLAESRLRLEPLSPWPAPAVVLAASVLAAAASAVALAAPPMHQALLQPSQFSREAPQ
jgi:hypothetical protein